MAKRQYAVDSKGPDDFEQDRPEPIGGWKLYNGRSDWFTPQVGGRYFYLPPDNGHTKDHPVMVDHPVADTPGQPDEPLQVAADGTLRVLDVVGEIIDPKTLKKTGRRGILIPARDICNHIIKNHGNHGISLLEGTIMDERIKENARKLFREAQLRSDKNDVEAYKIQLANWKKNHPDDLVPPPAENIRLAMERIDEYEHAKRDSMLFNCQCGLYSSNDFQKFKHHVQRNHGRVITEAEARGLENPEGETAEAPKRRGRPPKTEAVSA